MKVKLSLSLLLCFFVGLAWGQTRQVTGRVVSDSAATAMAGVNVTIKGTTQGTITSANGDYSISIPDRNNVVLVFSSIGFSAQEVSVGDKRTINVTLASSSAAMDVVIIGYQAVQRRDVLASVSSIGAKDLKDVPLTSAAEALNGRLAGVTASTSEGSPDANVRVRVRGGISITQNNDPLYIVDGVQVENALNVISPQDIQSIDVLKDAAATAIYGARGANGVILITTKTGRPGRTVITYDGFVGVRSLANKLEVMSPYEYVRMQVERAKHASPVDTTVLKAFGSTMDSVALFRNMEPIDWQKEIMGKTGISTRHSVSASGGNKRATFNIGYTFNKEKPIVINSDFYRHILNAKADYKVTNKLKVGIGGRYTYQNVVGAGVSNESNSAYTRLRNAVKYRPFLADTLDIDDQDPLSVNPGNQVALINPVALADAEYRKKLTSAYNLNANLSYAITKNLTFRSTFGYDRNDFNDRQFFDSITSFSSNQGGRLPISRLDTVYRKIITNSNVLTYSVKGFKRNHDFDILVGEETYDLRTDSRSAQYRDFPRFTPYETAFANNALGIPYANFPVFREARYTSLSFFGRLNYAFKDKYLLSVNARYDGASKFAPGKQWGVFPGGSIAWRVKQEKFMEGVDFISDLKFRVAYGKVGNNRIDDYLFLNTFNYGTSSYYLGGQFIPAYTQNSLANANLQWESLVNRNYGMDLSLFRGRINMSLDFYYNTSENLLLNAQIAPTFGFTSQLQNIGATSNKGVELQLSGTIIRKRDFNWTANLNVSHNKNTVEALAQGQTEFPAGPAWGISGVQDYMVRIGSPVGSMFGWVTDGFYGVGDFDYDPATTRYTLKSGVAEMQVAGSVSVPGGLRFKDISGPAGKPDGVINDFDKTIIGNATPKFSGGLHQTFNYKNWDASIFVNFSYGNDIYNANKIEFTSMYHVTSNLLDIMKDRWTTTDAGGNLIQTFQTVNGKLYAFGAAPDVLARANANAKLWMPAGLTYYGSGAGAYSYSPHSWAIEDGSFLRINNVTLGYTLPTGSVSKMGISRLRFYVTANNLAVFTKYTGYDPEVSVGSNGLTPGLDYSAYPKSRLFLFGVSASF
ncbi:MAG TPA: TonB-dependent receptor [Flavisolibacter sp.]|nr:TonB-dependent receptor [Flavisolibacter sp.]